MDHIKDLESFEIIVNIDKITEKNDFRKILENIKLVDLSTLSKKRVSVFFDDLNKTIPYLNLDYSDISGLSSAEISIYKEKVRFELSSVDQRLLISIGDNVEKPIKKSIDDRNLSNIYFDFNFIMGLLAGKYLDNNVLKINGNLSYKCECVSMSKFLNDVTKLTKSYFGKNNYNVSGFNFNYKNNIDNKDYDFNIEIKKDDKFEYYNLTYSFESKPLINIKNLWNILYLEIKSVKKIMSES